MGADFIPLAGPPTTPEFRAKHCWGSDYCCGACWGRGPYGVTCCADHGPEKLLTSDATGYPLRLPGCG